MAEPTIQVEVVHAPAAGEPVRVRLAVPAGTCALEAVRLSSIAARLPAGTLDVARLGIFSRRVAPEQVLREGDRVELYRPLALDPMEARRRRAR